MTLVPYAGWRRTIGGDQLTILDRISHNPGCQDILRAGDGMNWYKANLYPARARFSFSLRGQHLVCAAIVPFHPLTFYPLFGISLFGHFVFCVFSFHPRTCFSLAGPSALSSLSPRGLRFPTLTSRSHLEANLNTHFTLSLTLNLLGSRMEILVHCLVMDRVRPQLLPRLLVRMEESTQKPGQIRNITPPLLLGVSPFNRLEPILIKTFTLGPPLKLLFPIP